MSKTTWAWVSPLALLAAMALAGCGGGGGGGGGVVIPPGGGNATVVVPPGSLDALNVPANGVSQATTITLTASNSGATPNADINKVPNTIYDITANPPVTLTSDATLVVSYDPSQIPGQFDTQFGSVNGQGFEGVYGIGQVVNGTYTLLSTQGGGSGTARTATVTIPAGTTLGATPITFALLAPGGPTNFGVTPPNGPFTGALYQLFTYDSTAQHANRFTVDIVLNRTASRSDLQSIEYEGTVYNRANTPGFDAGIQLAPASSQLIANGGSTANNPHELLFSSASAGITLPKTALVQLAPVIQNVDYTIIANILTNAGGGATSPIEITGPATATSVGGSSTGAGSGYEFDIFHFAQ